MGVNDFLILLAVALFIAAGVVGAIQRSWVAALFCFGVALVVLSGGGLITS